MSVEDPSALEVIQATEVLIGGESLDGAENDELSSRMVLESAGVDTTAVGYVDSAIRSAQDMAAQALYDVAREFSEDNPSAYADTLERAAFLLVRARLLRQLTYIAGSMDADTQLESESEIIQEFKRMI